MPCKIEIKQNLTNKVSADTDSGFNLSIEGAQAVAKKVNQSYGIRVVSFSLNGDFIDRDIRIPDSLVDIYYNHELSLEQQEPVKAPVVIKPGVEELFNSNPELANAVYSALEFDINTLSYSEKVKKYKKFGITKSDGTAITEEDIKQNPTFYQNNTNQSTKEFIASEKTIRDLAARLSDRIGISARFESDRTKEYKGKLENNTAVINLAYATLDTPIHEILGHPIIRAIRDKRLNKEYDEKGMYVKNSDNQLYQNLLKELEIGKGKEVLDRIKKDYVYKNEEPTQQEIEIATKIAETFKKLGKPLDESTNRILNRPKYSLEEQQEEAIVELLGLMTAEKLDNVKDGKLISLLKRLLKEMKQFIRSLLRQREVEIDKLPDNMTLGDLSDLLAYSNSKLILPGYEVEYTTPDNMKFKTYQEASNHISELAKSVEDVDLDKNISVDNIDKEIETLQKELDNFKFEIEPFNKFTDVYTKKGRLRQNYWARKKDGTTGWTGGSKETLIEPEYDGFVLDIDRGDGRFITKISDKEAEELYYAEENKFNTTTKASREKYAELETKIHNLKNNSLKGFIEKNKEYEQSKEIIEEWKKVNNIQYNPEEIYSRGQEFSSVVGAYSSFNVNLMMQNLLQHIEDNEKAGGKFAISAYTKPIDKKIGHLEGGGGKIKFKLYPQSNDILWAANTDVYSGSVWDASEKVNKDKKSELLGVSYTKYPSLRNVNAVQPNLASIVDDLAHHHNELGIILTGNNFRLEYDEDIPYTTKKIINSINAILDQKYGKLVKPEIKQKQKIKDLEEILAYYNGNIIESPQKIIINGKESKSFVFDISLGKKFKSIEEAEEFRKSHISELKSRISNDLNIEIPFNAKKDFFENLLGIQPTQTNETLKEKINDVAFRVADLYEEGDTSGGDNPFLAPMGSPEFKQKEYTSQALINTKIAKLKEVAKKYPRSLIRSEVRPYKSTDKKQNLFDADELPFQLVSKKELTPKQQLEEKLKKQQALQLYSQYLDTIFPDSKVKDIVYHSRFNVDNIKNKDRWKNGFYSGTKDQADLMADMAESGSNDLMTTSALLINMQNPKVTTYTDRKVENYKNTNDGFIIEATEKDALQLIGNRDGYNTENFKKEYVVFEPEQIHILGGKQDIEGFKNFVAKPGEQLTMFQTDEMPASKASEETVSKIKELAKQAGISIQDLVEYAKANPAVNTKNANGLADIIKGIIAISQGRESEALTEEYVHIATAIIEQKNPQLITALISKIDRFKIYKQTLEAYKNKKDYQLPNGKPNIRKIKKEAVDKLITELIINQSEGSTEFPELMQEEIRSMVEEWWNTILDFFKGILTKTNVELFETIAQQVTSGELGGTVADITSTEGVFLQQKAPNKAVDDAYEAQKAIHDSMVYYPEILDASGKVVQKRHYKINGEEINITVTEKIDDSDKFSKERTDAEKRIDKAKMNFGEMGHNFIEHYITRNLIDKNGYARDIFLNEDVDSDLPQEVQDALILFTQDLIKSYSPGTRFLIETMVVNQKEEGMIGSKVDFKAYEPVEVKGEQTVRVDTLDWKFTSLDSKDKDDIAWYKVKKWKAQMGEYIKMDRELGITTQQTRKARMVPFVATWNYNMPGSKSSGITLSKLEIGKVDSRDETNVYLLPVPIDTETTGNKKLDQLVTAFQNYYEKLYTMSFGLNKAEKNKTLGQLSKAIKQLHMQLNFEPITAIGQQFLNNSGKALLTFRDIKYDLLSKEEIEIKLGELLRFKDSAVKFATIDEVYLSTYNLSDLDAEGKKILEILREISKRTTGMFEEITKLQYDYGVHIALKSKLTTEETRLSVLKPEIEITTLAKTFLEGTKLSNRIINLASNLILKARSLAAVEIGKAVNSFSPLIIDLEEQARKLGKSAFDMIGEEKNGVLRLIKKLDQKFYDQLTIASEQEDKQFFLDNMDIDMFKEKAEEYIEEQTEVLKNSILSTNEDENEYQINKAIRELNSSLNIESEQFDGYNNYHFNKFFKQSLKEENFYSEDFKNMKKSDAAFKVWSMFTSWNKKAYEMGYLDEEGMAFFPLMEATLLQKFASSDDKLTEGKDFFDDLYKMRIEEEARHSKVDPETGKVKKIIPKYYTRTDKAVHQLSRDLSKISVMYLTALTKYETSRHLENTLLTLHAIEQSKGTIITENGTILMEGGDPKVDLTRHKSADMLQVIIDDDVYGLIENLNSIGNVAISTGAAAVTSTEESKRQKELSTKKVLENSNLLIRALAVGLKPLLTISNYFGYNFQAYINAGNLYRYDKDFFPNHGRVVSGNLSIIEKALLDVLTPLNEDVGEFKTRQLAKKQSYGKWLATWTFSDAMMSTNSIPEKALELTHAASVIKNSIVVNGEVLNARQYLKEEDRKNKYKLSIAERKTLEQSFEKRVKELINSDKSLTNVAKFENDELSIPGISNAQLADLRVKILESGRKLSGQMSRDNKADFARDSILKSFMMFKTWIPKQITVRGMNMKKNIELDQWELGRTRAFLNVWNHLGTKRILEMRDIINGTEKGLAIMDKILKEKKDAYFQKTGQVLEISKEEFYDLMRQELANQMKELGLLFGLLGLVIAIKSVEPPEDEDALTKNRYRYLLKAANKISDELSFYYNPLSFESITKGSIMPQIGLLSKVWKFGEAITKEGYGYAVGDQKIVDKSHPLKYFLNLVPVAYQGQTDVLPLFFPEAAKDMGIRVTPQSRQ